MTMNIYDIDKAIEACVDTETGEIIDGEKLDALQMERAAKIEGVACWVKNLTAYEKALRDEEVALMEKRKRTAKRIEDLKAYLMAHMNGEKFKSARCSVGYHTSTRVEIADGASIPDEFLRQTVTVDKAGLKKALQAGDIIEGVALVEGKSIQIR